MSGTKSESAISTDGILIPISSHYSQMRGGIYRECDPESSEYHSLRGGFLTKVMHVDKNHRAAKVRPMWRGSRFHNYLPLYINGKNLNSTLALNHFIASGIYQYYVYDPIRNMWYHYSLFEKQNPEGTKEEIKINDDDRWSESELKVFFENEKYPHTKPMDEVPRTVLVELMNDKLLVSIDPVTNEPIVLESLQLDPNSKSGIPKRVQDFMNSRRRVFASKDMVRVESNNSRFSLPPNPPPPPQLPCQHQLSETGPVCMQNQQTYNGIIQNSVTQNDQIRPDGGCIVC